MIQFTKSAQICIIRVLVVLTFVPTVTWFLLSVCFSDREYPRLGQMIVDYENTFKKMMEEFVPHGKVRGDESIALLHNNILQKSEELWPTALP